MHWNYISLCRDLSMCECVCVLCTVLSFRFRQIWTLKYLGKYILWSRHNLLFIQKKIHFFTFFPFFFLLLAAYFIVQQLSICFHSVKFVHFQDSKNPWANQHSYIHEHKETRDQLKQKLCSKRWTMVNSWTYDHTIFSKYNNIIYVTVCVRVSCCSCCCRLLLYFFCFLILFLYDDGIWFAEVIFRSFLFCISQEHLILTKMPSSIKWKMNQKNETTYNKK